MVTIFNRRARYGPAVALGVLILGLMLATAGSVSADIPNDVCASCHDDLSEAFAMTPHGVFLSDHPSLSEVSCESCHGAGEAHVESEGEEGTILNPANHDQFGGQELCLSCHSGHQFDEWAFSAHNNANVGCASCHIVHGDPGQSFKGTTPDLCYTCHADVKAAFYMPSHHPIAEGKLSCFDCHGVHGEQPAMVMGDDKRDLCFSCHASMEGPFVFEHAPVNEDCGICHTPHGSVADNLLVQTEPMLCLNCHGMHFHVTVEGWDGDFEVPLDHSRNGTSTPEGWKLGMLTKCTQCHTAVHGTDVPSQTISTGGNALTR